MPQRVSVPGFGSISFPDWMPLPEIAAKIKTALSDRPIQESFRQVEEQARQQYRPDLPPRSQQSPSSRSITKDIQASDFREQHPTLNRSLEMLDILTPLAEPGTQLRQAFLGAQEAIDPMPGMSRSAGAVDALLHTLGPLQMAAPLAYKSAYLPAKYRLLLGGLAGGLLGEALANDPRSPLKNRPKPQP